MQKKRSRLWRRIAVGAVSLVVVGVIGAFVLKDYATPFERKDIDTPIYTIGDANYAAALDDGKKIVKFGPVPLGIYPGGLAFDDPETARAHLQELGKGESGWGVYQLSGDIKLDSTLVDGKRHLNKSLLVVRRITPKIR